MPSITSLCAYTRSTLAHMCRVELPILSKLDMLVSAEPLCLLPQPLCSWLLAFVQQSEGDASPMLSTPSSSCFPLMMVLFGIFTTFLFFCLFFCLCCLIFCCLYVVLLLFVCSDCLLFKLLLYFCCLSIGSLYLCSCCCFL